MAHGEILGPKQQRSTKPEQIKEVQRGYSYRKKMGGLEWTEGREIEGWPVSSATATGRYITYAEGAEWGPSLIYP